MPLLTGGGVNYFNGACSSYSITANAQHRIAIDLGADTELGMPMDINLCTGTTFDSTLYAGQGCPFSLQAYGCLAGNDDSCGAQSRITIPAVTQRYLYVVVSSFGTTGGSGGTYNLSWSYTLVSPTGTPTRSFT
jgi:hypothetical protein